MLKRVFASKYLRRTLTLRTVPFNECVTKFACHVLFSFFYFAKDYLYKNVSVHLLSTHCGPARPCVRPALPAGPRGAWPRGPLEARGPGQGPRSPMPKATTALRTILDPPLERISHATSSSVTSIRWSSRHGLALCTGWQ